VIAPFYASWPVTGLEPDGRALFELLVNKDPAHVDTLIARLSPSIRNELNGLNPAVHDLSNLRARVILLHGRSDTMIPYTESIALARALPREQAKLFLIDGFAHVDVKVSRKDIPAMLAAMEALLAERTHAKP
jgi:pimeloyl-ACP methyl ester carboxylesterase